MKLLKTTIITLGLVINFFLVKAVLAISAIERMRTLAGSANLPQTEATPQRIIINIIVYILGFVGLFFVGSIIYAPFEFMTSGGSEEKISKAKGRLKNSIIGVIIIIASYLITLNVADMLIKSTDSGNGFYGGAPGESPGSCQNDNDCVLQFGEHWICNNHGSCIYQ
ncbi:MAG: hypothetical protein NTZ18_00195 [Candidatus Komeilibacteria bacterium]|nr:hypothetical protein [Candidatus Komeilibacteria bacterium]